MQLNSTILQSYRRLAVADAMPLTNCYAPVWAAVEDDGASVPETPASQASSESLSRRSDFRKLYMDLSVRMGCHAITTTAAT